MKSKELYGADPVQKITSADDRQLWDAVNQQTLTTRGDSSEIDVQLIRPTGEQRTALVCMRAQREANSEVAYTVGRVQDIAERTTMGLALQTSGENLSMAAKLAHLGPWEYNLETNLFEFGDEFYAIYGTNVAREGRFMAADVYAREFVHPDDAWIVDLEISKALLLTERYYSAQLEHRIIRRDGEVRIIMVRGNVIKDAAGKIVKYYGVNQDITEQKAMEENLRASREKLSLAAELARLGPWEYNLETKLFEFGDEFYAIYGTDVAREGRFMATDVYVKEFVHPDDLGVFEAEKQKARLSSGQPYQLEHRIIRRDGEVRTIVVRVRVIRDAAGKIIKYYGANQDITERTQAEQALRESEERHNAILNALPDMLFRINPAGILLDYRIPDQYWRYLVKTTAKYSTIYDILPLPLAQRVKEMVISSVNLGKTKLAEYADPINGIVCSLQMRTAAINKKEVLVIIQDQTKLYRARRELQRLDSLDLIGKMAAGIGHEVRNPLTTVRGYLQFLSGKEQFKNHAEMFDIMIDELDRSNAIITEFLALSKNKAVKLEPKNLNSIITAIYPLLEVDAIAENKSICLELDDNIPPINVDESEIRQLIINFVRNGLEAMTGKGKLTIKTGRDDRHVMLVVRDNGTGIPESIMEQIGTPFVTTKDHGTGLGLSVCYSIAARHQATIELKTDKDGTEFTVRFNYVFLNKDNQASQ